jgi:hypothetical protein
LAKKGRQGAAKQRRKGRGRDLPTRRSAPAHVTGRRSESHRFHAAVADASRSATLFTSVGTMQPQAATLRVRTQKSSAVPYKDVRQGFSSLSSVGRRRVLVPCCVPQLVPIALIKSLRAHARAWLWNPGTWFASEEWLCHSREARKWPNTSTSQKGRLRSRACPSRLSHLVQRFCAAHHRSGPTRGRGRR